MIQFWVSILFQELLYISCTRVNFNMKKRNIRQQDVNKSQKKSTGQCNICSIIQANPKRNYLFQLNYERISRTINQGMQKPMFLSTINRILERQPSRQSITYQEVEKNLVFYQHLQQYFTIHQTNQRISTLIIKQIPYVKANYMDFKIKNFLILNKYRVINQKTNLPYPLCVQFEKQTDSKMSSTKSVQNKVLQELDKQGQTKKSKRVNNPQQQSKQITKKQNKISQKSKEKFQIKALTKGIQQMIQNIKDTRALENFKKQIEKTSQFKFDTPKFNDSESKEGNKNTKPKKDTDSSKCLNNLNQLREKQFKRKVDSDMSKNFPQIKNKMIIAPSKISSFRSIQRLQTVPDYGFQQYGLSVIKQKRKRSKSKKNKSKSGDYSHWCKQSTGKGNLSKTKRLQTQYDNSSTVRLNTAHSMLMKSKSSSRIPTQYDSGVILRSTKQKSKSKYEHFLFSHNTNKVKKQSKSSSISSQNGANINCFKKSKSKSKVKLMQFQSSTKLIKK